MGTGGSFPGGKAVGAFYITRWPGFIYFLFYFVTLLHRDDAGQLQHQIAHDRKRRSRNLVQPIPLLMHQSTMTWLCSAVDAELHCACCVVPRPPTGKVVWKGCAKIKWTAKECRFWSPQYCILWLRAAFSTHRCKAHTRDAKIWDKFYTCWFIQTLQLIYNSGTTTFLFHSSAQYHVSSVLFSALTVKVN
jgi:hypothetical protein